MAKEVKSDELPRWPVGTLEEFERDGYSPAQYPSCARPAKDSDGNVIVKGCPLYNKCTMSIRDKSGPRNFGVEIIKGEALGGHVIRRVLTCYKVVTDQDYHEQNEGVVTIIANEGETFQNVEVRRVKNEKGEPDQREMQVDVVVPAHPRPNENPALVRDRVKAMARKREMEMKKSERASEALGAGGSRLPLDSPQRRGPGRPPKDGGGQPVS